MPDPTVVTLYSVRMSLALNVFFFWNKLRIAFPIVRIIDLYGYFPDFFPQLQTSFRPPVSNNEIKVASSFSINSSPNPTVVFLTHIAVKFVHFYYLNRVFVLYFLQLSAIFFNSFHYR